MDNFYLRCKECGSADVLVGIPDTSNIEKPILRYLCHNCGMMNEEECKITGVSEDGKLQISTGPSIEKPKLIIA